MAKITAQAEPNGRCWCGCGEYTNDKRFFKQGCDATALSELGKRLSGNDLKTFYELTSNLIQNCRGKYINDATANLLLHFGYDSIENRLL